METQHKLITRAGDVVFDAAKIAILPEHDTLLVADMHFEKASFLQAKGGAPLPAYDTLDTLQRLAQSIELYKPSRVIVLGDSFHDVAAEARMPEDLLAKIDALCRSVEDFIWVLGNHDPLIPASICGAREDHVELGEFLLTHEQVDAGTGVNICGHFHPKLRVKTRRGKISAPCFAWDDARLILPSFGTYTGGLDVTDDALQAVLSGDSRYCAVSHGGLYCF